MCSGFALNQSCSSSSSGVYFSVGLYNTILFMFVFIVCVYDTILFMFVFYGVCIFIVFKCFVFFFCSRESSRIWPLIG